MNRYNVRWDSPSRDCHGSMPIGNGDLAANVWVEPNGDLVFYLSKSDAWSGGGDNGPDLLKLGRVRLTLDPPLYSDGATFKQELDLETGAIRVEVSGVRGDSERCSDFSKTLRPGVALRGRAPTVCDCVGALPRSATGPVGEMFSETRGQVSGGAENFVSENISVSFEEPGSDERRTGALARPGQAGAPVLRREPEAALKPETRLLSFWIDANRPVVHIELDSSVASNVRVAVESWRAEGKWLQGGAQPDTFAPSAGETIRWYQRNTHSVYENTLEVQRLGHLKHTFADPLLHRTFGGLIEGEGLVAQGDRELATRQPVKRVHLRVHALTAQTETPEGWLSALEAQRRETNAVVTADTRTAHEAWWQAFWERSYIHVTGDPDAEQAGRIYQLQRWIQACAGRGAYPIKFNGSLFTVDAVDEHWHEPDGRVLGPDYRRWNGPYWWQNTRLIYWPMLYSGDYDMMLPLFRMYLDMLPLLRERTRHYYGHDGVYFSETTQIWGLNRNCDFGEDNPTFTNRCPYTRWEWQGGLELGAMMLDYYRHTLDDAFARDLLLPIVDDVLRFYDLHYPRAKTGKMVITPAQSLETWHSAIDPLPEIAGLHVVVQGMLDLPASLVRPEQRQRWERLQGELPDIPLADADGARWIKPARLYDEHRNAENPELYAVFPYQTHMVGKADLDVARETYARRINKETGGWKQNAIHAAMLGLTDEARDYLVGNLHQKGCIVHKGQKLASRFPAFFGPGVDWLPDQDHASVIITTLQRMLLLTDGRRIQLLPAWPQGWNAEFKLHAPGRTVVEGRVENGELRDLEVTPESRRGDVKRI